MTNSDNSHQSNLQRDLFGLSLDAAARDTLQSQLMDGLRRKVLSSAQYCGLRLPASRVLAAELSVSRMTVQMVYDQLVAEGYLVTRRGAGTFVAQDLPHLARVEVHAPPQPPAPRAWPPFQTSLPDLSLMPHAQWARHLDQSWRNPEPALLARPDPFGWYPLRAAIADHLGAWRQLACRPEQVVITSGAREAFEIIFRGLLPEETCAAIEDPGWPRMRHALIAAGSRPLPCRIDVEGFDSRLIPPQARAVIVTPSRHYPTGRSLGLPRRMALLDWAQRSGGLVIEDDYDSEFRYRGQPLPTLAGLDGKRVVYLGSFSKLLNAQMRLGYMVLPEARVPEARAHLGRLGAQASLTPQPALARLMQSGEFGAHLRRMRRVYARRQAHLLAALAPVADLVELAPDMGGMHLCVPLKPALAKVVTDRAICAEATGQGLAIGALSTHCQLPDPLSGLLLGYAGFDEDTLSEAAIRLGHILRAASLNGL
ncbi:PLP-dependent aminotransferase family protein [Thioclava kandeliae]|uniref:PLP-dependent aminotransferase family protein n=1 Tax=Thioclava kandeliae TaxID=3070818 RepID=A0ABV1SEL6_9RHOB